MRRVRVRAILETALLQAGKTISFAVLLSFAAALLAASPGYASEVSEEHWNTEDKELTDFVVAVLRGEETPPPPEVLSAEPYLIYAALRQRGAKLSEDWSEPGNGGDFLRAALGEIAAALQTSDADTAEVSILYSFSPVPGEEQASVFSNVNRGIIGIEMSHGEDMLRFGPSQMIAGNLSFQKVIARFAEEQGIAEDNIPTQVGFQRFDAAQFLISVEGEAVVERLFRGNLLVDQTQVTEQGVADLARRMGAWMSANLQDDGRMVYRYWPSRSRESISTNMIRQWMASVCLVRLGRHLDDSIMLQRAEQNIRYNLAHYYSEEEGLGLIEHGGKVKLGALALAALAIAEHPERESLRAYEDALGRSIDVLWQSDGSFRTFLKPADRTGQDNFYPGEALLYQSTIYRETKDPVLLQRIEDSADHYWSWHLAHRNPAFTPWHTIAYANIWQETANSEFSDKIIEMNDWLLSMQQSAPEAYPDVDGRFYDPDRQQFGPPHASSTGVYLEGLIQAYKVASDLEDTERAEAYRRGIVQGIRSLMQLEFRDDIDMYYVSARDQVRGGIRTTVYNNEIRVDNVQHGLMALLQILRTFEADDYLLE